MSCARCFRALRSHAFTPWPAPLCRLPASAAWRATSLQDSPGPRPSFHSGPRLEKEPSAPLSDVGGAARKEGRPAPLSATDDFFSRAASSAQWDQATFERVLATYCRQEARRRGHVEFIYAALRRMPEFGVERELTVYNRLLDVFPKEVFVPRNFIQRMFNHFPRQQECAVQVLEQMENYGVLPDVNTKVLLVQIFGHKSHPMRKYQRMLYWFPRFRHANPFPVAEPLPQDPVELARLALLRIAPDLDSEVTVYQHPQEEEGPDGRIVCIPHLVGLQSPEQRELLAQHDPHRPVFVEGPFPLWLRRTCLHYYLLRSDPLPPELKVTKPLDLERNLFYPMELDLELERDLGDDDDLEVEEVEEGPVFALCQAGSGDPALLTRWISGLQETNPKLSLTPVLFRTAPASRQLEPASGISDGTAGKEEEKAAEPGAWRVQDGPGVPESTAEEQEEVEEPGARRMQR
ncbi:evolutionarily conserved signaling intermediate in Toll pathway, mitochondrial [Mobula birostris]|uniref:evolutionarily conserved signaling intermediate in Toll pathway, mitochondrial n=1 Tax=Mobula birostris TaxID=1983395 RepID=UPI003B28D27F